MRKVKSISVLMLDGQTFHYSDIARYYERTVVAETAYNGLVIERNNGFETVIWYSAVSSIIYNYV